MKKLLTLLCLLAFSTSCSYDDKDILSNLNDLENRVETLETKVESMNKQVTSIQTVIDAINKDKLVKEVTKEKDGYTLKFNDDTIIEIKTTKEIPIIGVKKDTDNKYYWISTIDGKETWLLDENSAKLPVSGTNGTDGTNGVTPKMGVDAEGFWTIDLGEGATRMAPETKATGKDGDSFFKEVTSDKKFVYITLANDEKFTLPMASTASIDINPMIPTDSDYSGIIYLKYNASKKFGIDCVDIVDITMLSQGEGWDFKYENNILTIKSPITNGTGANKGEVTFIGTDGYRTIMKKITVIATDNTIETLGGCKEEGLANSTYGTNLYGNDCTKNYYMETGLMFLIPKYKEVSNFYSGGVAISQWNDMTTNNYKNQCSVYSKDKKTGFGGHNGSKTFGVGYCTNFGAETKIFFLDDTTEKVFKSIYLSNNTYSYLSMKNGEEASNYAPLSYENKDYLLLKIEGINKAGETTGTIDYYMADFRETTSKGIDEGWKKVDLSSLGAVNSLKFVMEATRTNSYGTTIPTYFCFDDLTIK
ncbi:MAG: DUF4465 domain-containing protein [Bacteroidetes bacterium]|nr:DUF4465 domain-containing protein [Bacteroidota bacterium]